MVVTIVLSVLATFPNRIPSKILISNHTVARKGRESGTIEPCVAFDVCAGIQTGECASEESPIVFEDRRYGVTKINLRECLTAVRDILRLGWQNLRGEPVEHPPSTGEER